MSKFISITSGSKSILTKIINKYPEHRLYLYKSTTENNYKLIDWFPYQNIFKLPLSYQVLNTSSQIKKYPFINLIFLKLDKKQLSILSASVQNQLSQSLPSKMTSLFELQSRNNPANIIIGSSWLSNPQSIKWISNSFISPFLSNPNNNGFQEILIKIK